ncbi:MAG: alkaline phosphatase family protein [Bacteroidota bacterium]|nr:alkaline phosphatase family protein [Bacteroidota bacterium]
MIKRSSFLFVFIIVSNFLLAQSAKKLQKPKLVIGLVIDQMRWDYLYRYNDLYGSGGFKRLINDGFSCDHTLIPFVPTYTGPGHTCIYTGSIPSIHGIVANDWYDSNTKKNVYCTDDSTVNTIGSESDEGKMSPRNLLVTTIGDELRLSTNFRSKVIGISLKDRASILPAGHSANAAYWFDGKEGKWISSSYYQNQLPDWVVKQNEKGFPDIAMSKDWNTLLPINKYVQSTSDDEKYEDHISGDKTVTFPHHLSQITKGRYSAFKYTPASMAYTFDMAKQAVKNEKLGVDNFTDMLTISISTTDYVGHAFGPNSVEAEDTYLNLDKDIADFLNYLDVTVGKGNYVLFLTADHGVEHVPGFMEEHNIPGGNYSSEELSQKLKQEIEEETGLKNVIIKIQNSQVYVNDEALKKAGKDINTVNQQIIDFLNRQPVVEYAFATKDLATATIPSPIKCMLINGYNPKRSGQIGFISNPGYISEGSSGTTHGAWNPYDAHIPLIWFGTNIKPGKTTQKTYMSDIAPTIAALLNIQMPSGNVGEVIEKVME